MNYFFPPQFETIFFFESVSSDAGNGTSTFHYEGTLGPGLIDFEFFTHSVSNLNIDTLSGSAQASIRDASIFVPSPNTAGMIGCALLLLGRRKRLKK